MEGRRERERDLRFSLFWSGQGGTYFGNGDRGALYVLGQPSFKKYYSYLGVGYAPTMTHTGRLENKSKL